MDYGVCDMKGGIASILNAISKIDLEKNKLGIYLTYDEEIGFNGIKEIKNLIDAPNIIIGEPTNNILVYGSKGLLEYEILFFGKKVHSSIPEKGENAIYSCIEFISRLKSFYNTELIKDKISEFDVPYTTMNIGIIKGGESINSVPETCSITVDFRISQKEHIPKIKNKIMELLKPFKSSYTIVNEIDVKLNYNDLSWLENISGKKQTMNGITEASFIKNNSFILGVRSYDST